MVQIWVLLNIIIPPPQKKKYVRSQVKWRLLKELGSSIMGSIELGTMIWFGLGRARQPEKLKTRNCLTRFSSRSVLVYFWILMTDLNFDLKNVIPNIPMNVFVHGKNNQHEKDLSKMKKKWKLISCPTKAYLLWSHVWYLKFRGFFCWRPDSAMCQLERVSNYTPICLILVYYY